jgi:hypothetical protein
MKWVTFQALGTNKVHTDPVTTKSDIFKMLSRFCDILTLVQIAKINALDVSDQYVSVNNGWDYPYVIKVF